MMTKKEASKKEVLKDFLNQYCELKPIMTGAVASKDKCYVLPTKDCKLFMAEAHVQGMRNAIGQTDEVMADAKKYNDYTRVIMTYNWSAPDPGMDLVQIPERLVEMLSIEQASVIVRNLQGIFKDIEEGRSRRSGLQALFGDKAIVKTAYALDGERQFFITGKTSASDNRRYAERYAEQVATNALFDLAKALNSQLKALLPKEAQGKYFVEGRDTGAKKIRYGADAFAELILTDEGALIHTELAKEQKMKEAISHLFQKAMTDPFGLSLKHYMGKRAVIKLKGKKEEG
jgi:hypothetical protein